MLSGPPECNAMVTLKNVIGSPWMQCDGDIKKCCRVSLDAMDFHFSTKACAWAEDFSMTKMPTCPIILFRLCCALKSAKVTVCSSVPGLWVIHNSVFHWVKHNSVFYQKYTIKLFHEKYKSILGDSCQPPTKKNASKSPWQARHPGIIIRRSRKSHFVDVVVVVVVDIVADEWGERGEDWVCPNAARWW